MAALLYLRYAVEEECILSGGSRISQAEATTPGGGGTNPLFGIIFAENCMNIKEKLTKRRGAHPSHPLDPPLIATLQTVHIPKNTRALRNFYCCYIEVHLKAFLDTVKPFPLQRNGCMMYEIQ